MPGGQLTPNTRLFNNPYGYNGEDYDIESGLQFLRARYYNPETARFITRDSYLGDVMEPLSLNRYAYTANNPVKYTDPSGHEYRSQDEGNKQVEAYNVLYHKSLGQPVKNGPVLKIGSTDRNSIKELQTMLINLDYDLGPSGADGYFGEKTKAAVLKFQKFNGLDTDGIVGAKTWKSLQRAETDKQNIESILKIKEHDYVDEKAEQAKTVSKNENGCGGLGDISSSLWDKAKGVANTVVETYETTKFIAESVIDNPVEFFVGVSKSFLDNTSLGIYDAVSTEPFYFDGGEQTAYMTGKTVFDLGSTAAGAVATFTAGSAAGVSGAAATATSPTVAGALAFGTVSLEAAAITGAAAAFTGNSLKNFGEDAEDLFSYASNAKEGAAEATRMTTKQATAAAKELGYEPTNYVTKSGEKVFYNKKTKTYISQDVGSGNGMGSHNGGVWKAAKSPEALNSKETRLGTYDANLNRIGD